MNGHCVRKTVRSLLPVACASLLAIGGCVPLVYHDGLPAWTPPEGMPELSIGCHRMFSSDGWSDSLKSTWYLTPGARVGLARPPRALDLGLTSVLWTDSGGGPEAALFAVLGVGYQQPDGCLVSRISFYLLGFSEEGTQSFFSAEEPVCQFSVLGGLGARTDRTHLSFGGRSNFQGFGPVLLVDHSFGPASLRLEGSLMLSTFNLLFSRLKEVERLPPMLTIGLTVGGPAPQGKDK